jgi:hypothetical protein
MPWTTETILKAVALAPGEECVTEARIAELTGLTAKQVEQSTLKLRKHGFLNKTGRGCHKITQAGKDAVMGGGSLRSGPKGRHTGQRNCSHGMRQRVWNVLRMGGKRTVDDILMLVIEGGERDARSNVRKYLQALVRGRYVTVMQQREAPLNNTSNGCLRYLLVNDTGPLAPVWRVSRGTLYDPNFDGEVAFQEAA